MNAIDIVCLILIALFTLIGIWHGFLRSIFRLLAWIAAFAGAYYANDFLSEFVMETLGLSPFSTTICCVALGFLIPFLGFLFIGHLLKNAISNTSFGKIDRVLGGFLGLVKSLLICFAIFSILHIMPFGKPLLEARDNSAGYSAYRSCLELMGYSSEPIDLVGVAEQKASELTQKAVEKATDKANEVAKEAKEKAIEKASEVAKDAADKALDEAKEAAQNTINEAGKKISEEKNGVNP